MYQSLLKRYFKLETLITMTIWPLEMIFKPIIMNKLDTFSKGDFFPFKWPKHFIELSCYF